MKLSIMRYSLSINSTVNFLNKGKYDIFWVRKNKYELELNIAQNHV